MKKLLTSLRLAIVAIAIIIGLTAHADVAQANLIQSGVVTVGNHYSPFKEVVINFPQPFPVTPSIVANTLQEPNLPPVPDAYAVSIVSVNSQQAVARVYRVDTPNGWAQNLQLGWIAHSL